MWRGEAAWISCELCCWTSVKKQRKEREAKERQGGADSPKSGSSLITELGAGTTHPGDARETHQEGHLHRERAERLGSVGVIERAGAEELQRSNSEQPNANAHKIRTALPPLQAARAAHP